MIPKFASAFKVGEEDCKGSRSSRNNFGGHVVGSKKGTVVVGLKILVEISQGKSNIVIKPAALIRHSSKLLPASQTQLSACKSTQYSCFLKSCVLCSKNLSLDKDVYMYKGDQGFCSVECRNRQIVLDDMRELESSTKKMVASYRSCSQSDRKETQILLHELRQRQHKPHHNQKIHWTIIS